MSTATKKLPAHGTYARANGSPGYREACLCDRCVPVKLTTRKRHSVNRQLGRAARIDATPARKRLILLHNTMCWRTLGIATGCDASNLMLIHNGTRTQITRTTHDKIMAVRPAAKPDLTVYVDVTGTRRRIQAMQAIGHSFAVIAEAAGTTRWRVGLIADGHQPTVSQAIADRIADAYRHLSRRPAPFNRSTNRSRNHAATNGWHGPLAWGSDINDPTAKPDMGDDSSAPTGPIVLRPCGTTAAHRRHLRRGEPVDEACRLANNLAVAERKDARKRAAA